MRKIIVFSASIAAALFMVSPFVYGNLAGEAGNSNTGHLYLYQKDSVTWEIVEGGAWGKMTYKIAWYELKFTFNGHLLEAGTDYSLIYYPNPWPGNGLIVLGSAVAGDFGDVYIEGPLNIGDLPKMYDDNYPDGAKIWLVLSSDVNTDTCEMANWNPDSWLFEDEMIVFDDTSDSISLYQKDDSWTVVEGGAEGILMWNPDEITFDFTFQAWYLEPSTGYTLLYYPDPWPGEGMIALGDGVSCSEGCVHISGSQDIGDLPIESDENYPGAKIWLVLSEDLSDDQSHFVAWNPDSYLFEGELMSFEDLDD